MPRVQHSTVLSLLTIFLFILPVWLFAYFPAVDGLAHIANGRIVKDMLLGNCPLYTEYYEFNPYPVPNWLSHALAALLTTIFPNFTAEKIIVTIFIALFVYSFRYLVISLNRENEWVSYFALLFVASSNLIFGTYNFCFSVCFLLLGVGYWVRTRERDNHGAQLFTFGLIFLLAYFSHIVGFAALCIAIALLSLARIIFGIRSKLSGREIWRRFSADALLPFAASVPFLLMFYCYAGAGFLPREFEISNGMKLKELLFPSAFVAWHAEENFIAQFVAIFIYYFVILQLWQKLKKLDFTWRDAIFDTSFVLLMAIFLVPESMFGGWSIAPRLNYIALILLCAWLALGSVNTRKIILPVILLASISLQAYRIYHFAYSQPMLAEFYTARAHIKPGSVIQTVNFLPMQMVGGDESFTSFDVYPLYRVATGMASESCSIDVLNYEPKERYTFPIVYSRKYRERFGNDISEYFHPEFSSPDFAENMLGRKPDYMILWAHDMFMEAEKIAQKKEYLNSLTEYEAEYTSPSGLLHLYKRK